MVNVSCLVREMGVTLALINSIVSRFISITDLFIKILTFATFQMFLGQTDNSCSIFPFYFCGQPVNIINYCLLLKTLRSAFLKFLKVFYKTKNIFCQLYQTCL